MIVQAEGMSQRTGEREMKIRRALMEELDEIMEIYDHAKQVMRASGNKDQWTDGYPPRELVSGDIADGMEYLSFGISFNILQYRFHFSRCSSVFHAVGIPFSP